MTAAVRDRILRIIADQAMLEPNDLDPAMTPADLGIDSLGLVESIFALEEEFDISIPFNANAPAASDFDISSIGSIIVAVERLVAANAS